MPYDPSTLTYYEEHAEEYCESTINLNLHELYKPFLRELNAGAHILDAGCGSGRDTKEFIKRGYRVTAIDGSPKLARLATAFTGQSCRVLSFDKMDFHEEFDGIWACASLLHVPKQEMQGLLPRFIQALKPGGILCVTLKEGDGEGIANDGRLFSYYTAASFRSLLVNFPDISELTFQRSEGRRSHHHSGPWLLFVLKRKVPVRNPNPEPLSPA
jgi:SAM-dependent methyltransferase